MNGDLETFLYSSEFLSATDPNLVSMGPLIIYLGLASAASYSIGPGLLFSPTYEPVLNLSVPEVKTDTALLPEWSPKVGTTTLSSRG